MLDAGECCGVKKSLISRVDQTPCRGYISPQGANTCRPSSLRSFDRFRKWRNCLETVCPVISPFSTVDVMSDFSVVREDCIETGSALLDIKTNMKVPEMETSSGVFLSTKLI